MRNASYKTRLTTRKKIATMKKVTFILAVVMGFAFIGWGISCFAVPMFKENFENFGYGRLFRYLIGFTEIVGGIGLLMPKFRLMASGVLLLIMAGAVYSHVRAGDQQYLSAAIHGAILMLVLSREWVTRSQESGYTGNR